MTASHDVPSDLEPDTLGDLIDDAQWLVVAAPPVRLRPEAFARPQLPRQRGVVIDITDACVTAADGFGD